MEPFVARRRVVLIVCSTLSLVVGGLIGFLTPHPQGRPVTVVTPEPTATPAPTPTPTPLRVYVYPAVYRLPPGSLVEDAVRAAGGAAPDADLDGINLARELSDQQQVYVPREGETDPPPPLSGGEVSPPEQPLVNINTATAAELEALPNIGPTTAQRIIEYRQNYGPFESIEQIMEVPGIGQVTFEKIQVYITVEQAAP